MLAVGEWRLRQSEVQRSNAKIRVWISLCASHIGASAALVLADLVNEASANAWHRYFGYAAAGLIAIRLLWVLAARRTRRCPPCCAQPRKRAIM